MGGTYVHTKGKGREREKSGELLKEWRWSVSFAWHVDKDSVRGAALVAGELSAGR